MLALRNKKIFRFHQIHTVSRSRARWSAILRRTGILALAILTGVSFMLASRANAASSFRAALGGNNGGGASTLVLTKPSSPSTIVAGDVMIAVVTVRGGTDTTITPPSGWSLINSNDSGTTLKSSTYYKIATASEGASYSWGLGASALKASGVISAYSGVDPLAPIMAQSQQVNTSSTTMTAPSVTTTVDGAMVIAVYSSPSGATFSQGSSMTMRGQSSSTGNPATSQTTSGLQDAVQATLGASGTKTMTQSIGDVSIGHTLALNPKPTFEQSGYRWFDNADATSATFAKSWGGTGADTARALALDSAGNIYVAGYTISSGLTAGSFDQTLVKYNSSGVEQWSKTWGDTGTDTASALALDSAGNIYVAGYTDSPGLTAGGTDQTLVKYNSAGVEQWSKTWGGTGNDYANALALDSAGNIYVAGYTRSSGLTAGGNDQTLVKYNSAGVEQWSKTWGGTGNDYANALALDSAGNIYVAGYTISSGLTAGSFDQTLVKYNSSGVEQWSKTWGDTGTDTASALALDSAGNIYVAGSTDSPGLTAGSFDQTLVKYNSAGVEQWSKTWGGTGNDYANALALDSAGNIYVAGSTDSPGLTAGGTDQTLVKYNSAGVEQWSKTWGGTGNDYANALALDSAGNIYVAGETSSPGLTAGAADQTLLKFDSTGAIGGCSSCVDRTMTEVDRTTTEVDRTTTEVNRTVTEVDRTVTEVDRTNVATITIVCNSPGPIDVSTPLATQNTAANTTASPTPFRLRTLLHVAEGTAIAGNTFKLQYAPMSGTCDIGFSGETYADVTASTPIAFADNPAATDGVPFAANANDPTHSSHTNIIQEYNEANPTDVTTTIPAGQDGLWDFALKDNGGTAGTSYCLRIVKSDGALLDAYSVIPQINILSSATLSLSFVDNGGNAVTNPNFGLGAVLASGTFQTTSGSLGDTSRRLRLANTTYANGWNVTVAPTDGPTAVWNRSDSLAKYDFNDSGSSGTDSAVDTDSLGGQLSLNPTLATLTPQSGCSATGVTKGSNSSFVEGTVNSVTLLSATNASQQNCYWDFYGIGVSQTIPASQSAGTYTISLTATAVSL